MLSNGPSRKSRPLATQFSAMSPARQRFSAPVCRRTACASLKITSSVTTCTERARSICRCASGASGVRAWPPNNSRKRSLMLATPEAKSKYARLEPERTVVFGFDQPPADQIDVLRLTVGCQAHQLVFAGIDLEAAILGEDRVEQAQRVRKRHLPLPQQPIVLAQPRRCRRPLADPVQAEHSRPPERARKGRRRRRASERAQPPAATAASPQ